MEKEKFQNLLNKAISSPSIKQKSVKFGASIGKKTRPRKTVGALKKQSGKSRG